MRAGTESAMRRADPSEAASLGIDGEPEGGEYEHPNADGGSGGPEGAEHEGASGEEHEGAEHESASGGGDGAEHEGAEHEGASVGGGSEADVAEGKGARQTGVGASAMSDDPVMRSLAAMAG